ncbi:hypothetical protein FISHEDRAFT_32292 [Fistulina hepatica ATCC 64428]|uniref:Uncharacterized protein n=1 Tax=Fistulina hepatica ATCC 64428 TaxID=1128425 RepID=A0A0D7ARJ2_9AGAR|nr:hypothetical protein FISHEDRAFT_32292 [Fistulina hepatica ATCC 64428]
MGRRSYCLSESLFADLSTRERLSRTTSSTPPLEDFEPFIFRGSPPAAQNMVTACVWVQDSADLQSLYDWSRNWTGPISLLVTTNARPESEDHRHVLNRIRALAERDPALSLSVHLLHVKRYNEQNHNTYLNLARLFAPTERVLLFPGDPHLCAIPNVHVTLLDRDASLPLLIADSRPAFPFPPMSPIVVRRDHPAWCTERFFFAHSRLIDWQECTWSIWLESFGSFDHLNATVGPVTGHARTPNFVVCRLPEQVFNYQLLKTSPCSDQGTKSSD